MRILLVEDDLMIGQSLKKVLKTHVVNWVEDTFAAERTIGVESYDLILLDLGLPKRSGIEYLTQLRATGNTTPVLIITARDGIEDRVKGLDSGADDYLLKPFAIDELEARIRALTRRKENRSNPVIEYAGTSLDPASYTMTYKNVSERLSVRAFGIMQTLIENPGVIFSRNQLEEKVYGWNDEVESNAVEVHIHMIRRKFGSEIILNVRGVGYTFPKMQTTK
ncbi:MAG: response regulator transcription factor [Methylotenera sp.]|uniref:response regulator transcription factor n=1 Tax=Methylotenera sp. TaxID=2051956 RepID=UPI002489F30A|nr:response regulator transcription factor [Methylotenera sp.]MDI1310465.1 response regulator transcription factor [Methylotenera sp.]